MRPFKQQSTALERVQKGLLKAASLFILFALLVVLPVVSSALLWGWAIFAACTVLAAAVQAVCFCSSLIWLTLMTINAHSIGRDLAVMRYVLAPKTSRSSVSASVTLESVNAVKADYTLGSADLPKEPDNKVPNCTGDDTLNWMLQRGSTLLSHKKQPVC